MAKNGGFRVSAWLIWEGLGWVLGGFWVGLGVGLGKVLVWILGGSWEGFGWVLGKFWVGQLALKRLLLKSLEAQEI